MSPRPATRAQLGHLRSLYRALDQEPPPVTTRAGAYHAIEHAKQKLAATPPPPSSEPPPTPAQLHDLAVLARRAGIATPEPATTGAASRAIRDLKALQEDERHVG